MIMRTHLYKAIPKDSEDRKYFSGGYASGSLRIQDETTYCFKEDYDKFPENRKYYISFDEMTDWGLPNKHLYVEVLGETICEAVDGLFGYEKIGDKSLKRQLFEGDIVNIKTTQYSFKNYVIKYSREELCWTAVSQEEKTGEISDSDSPFDEIKLSSKWDYEFLGNVNDKFVDEKRKENKNA